MLELFNVAEFMPHGACYSYRPDILALNLTGDGIISAAYLSIPLLLIYITQRRPDLMHVPISGLFSAFITLCGITHLFGIWVIWYPDYGVQGVLKLITGLVSVITAFLIWRWIPNIIRLPSIAEIRSTNAELSALNVFLDSVLNNIKDGIVACDSEGRLTLFNRATREFHGIDVEKLPPEQWAERFSLYKADGKTTMSQDDIPLYRAFTGQEVTDQEMVIAPKNGVKRQVLASGQPMLDAAGNKVGAVVSMHDITRQRSVEEQLYQSQKLESLGRLTGGISHDFNNLLGVIIGNLDILKDLIKSDPQAEELVDEAMNAALSGGELNQRLLAFARRQVLRPQRIKIDEFVTNTIRLMARSLGEQITIDFVSQPNLWPVELDSAQLEASILNLGVNARDAMGDGGTLKLELQNIDLEEGLTMAGTSILPGRYVMLTVSDTGKGMAPDVLDKSFEPFFTTKEAGAGSGLGLSMVHGFMQQSGGHVTIYSEPGMGTTVKLYFPCAEDADDVETGSEEIAAVPRGSAQTILIVEDNEGMRKIVRKQLQSLGYRTVEAATGAAALDVLESDVGKTIDLVFSDVVMPDGFNGIELAREVVSRYPEIRVLLTSGFADAALELDTIENRHIRLLSKPYRFAKLADAVNTALTMPQNQ